MINGRQERLEKILRVRYRNLKLHKGRRAVYITFAFFYFLFDLIVLILGAFPPAAGATIISLNFGMIGFIFALCQAVFLGIIGVCMSAQLFASDRVNNQIGIELRSGYDQRDIFLSRFIEILIAFAIIWVVTALVNGFTGGIQWQGTRIPQSIIDKFPGKVPAYDNRPYMQVPNLVTGAKHYYLDPRLQLNRAWSVITIWYSLIAFILTTGITIGFSYIINMSGSIALGVIFGIGLTIVIILASVGTFSPAGFGSIVPGYGHTHNLEDFMMGTYENGISPYPQGIPSDGGKGDNDIVQMIMSFLVK